MSRDSDLVVSCKCGKLQIVKIGGYYSSDLLDAADLGVQAERLCRRKRLRKWALSIGIPMIAGAILVGGTGWIVGEVGRRRVQEAGRLGRDSDDAIRDGDDARAIDILTKAIVIHPTAVYHLKRGFCYYRLGLYDKAIADCDEALKLEPGNEGAKRNGELAMRYKK